MAKPGATARIWWAAGALRPVAKHQAPLRFVRFALVGGSASLVYAAAVAILAHSSEIRYTVAIATYLALVPPTWLAQRRLVFRSRRRFPGEFMRYLAVQAVGICLASAAVPQLATGGPTWNFGVYLGNAAAAAAVSFVLSSLFVFAPRQEATNEVQPTTENCR